MLCMSTDIENCPGFAVDAAAASSKAFECLKLQGSMFPTAAILLLGSYQLPFFRVINRAGATSMSAYSASSRNAGATSDPTHTMVLPLPASGMLSCHDACGQCCRPYHETCSADKPGNLAQRPDMFSLLMYCIIQMHCPCSQGRCTG